MTHGQCLAPRNARYRISRFATSALTTYPDYLVDTSAETLLIPSVICFATGEMARCARARTGRQEGSRGPTTYPCRCSRRGKWVPDTDAGHSCWCCTACPSSKPAPWTGMPDNIGYIPVKDREGMYYDHVDHVVHMELFRCLFSRLR